MTQFLRRYWPWLVVLIAAVAYYPRFIGDPAGMVDYPPAARCLLDNAVLQKCAVPFTYPPFFALVMIPFAPMPLWLRDLVWYLVTLAAAIGSFALAERIACRAVAVPLTPRELGWLRLLALVLSLKVILAVFETQAYDALVLVFVLLGLAALMAGRELCGGAGLAVGAALKATPLIFLPYLIWKRHFAAAAAFAAVFLIASYLPDMLFTPVGGAHGYFNTWLHEVAGASFGIDPGSAKFVFWRGANVLNHSLRGAVSLNIDETTQHALHHAVLYAVDGAFVVVVATLIALSPRGKPAIAIDGSLLLISMLMLTPMTSRSHYIMLILPYMTLVALLFRDDRTAKLGRIVLALSFVLITLTSNDVVGRTVTGWAYSHSFLVLGTLVLLIYFAAVVIRRYRDERAGAAKAASPARPQATSPSG